MKMNPTYAIETRSKTRNLGLVTSLLLVPLVFVFM
jgi:hypothetical protein